MKTNVSYKEDESGRYRAEVVNSWKTAIGLQAVDGLQPSDYFYTLAGQHIEGAMDIKQVQENLKSYYDARRDRKETVNGAEEEADRVAANIMELLQDERFSLSVDEYRSIHESLFIDIFPHAGSWRLADIYKNEWVLQYDSVQYGEYYNIIPELEKEMSEERQFDYTGLTEEEKIRHLADFIARVWQIHPFYEGNTRTTAVFAVRYLRSMGREVDNEVFRQHSWYFRNALARACYSNAMVGIKKEPEHLYRFFQNLLMGTDYKLQNRNILILSAEERERKNQVDRENGFENKSCPSNLQISDVSIFKDNADTYMIKCNVNGVEQESKNVRISDLFKFSKLQKQGNEKDINDFLESLARLYFGDKTNNLQKRQNSFKR